MKRPHAIIDMEADHPRPLLAGGLVVVAFAVMAAVVAVAMGVQL
ncbi:MAG TPA: hypothetical protein VNK48_14495 [Xanthobacteraceae bacterium]|nr:hypothetical protein [Xanthobacteraceae bacterium]